MAGLLAVDRRVDVDDAAVALRKFRDLNGRAVRNFTLEIPQQLFADDLRHDLPLRLVRRHIVREQERAVGRVAGALPQQVRDTVAELRGHRNDGVELKFCGIGRDDGKQILLLDRVDLVDNEDDRRMRGAKLAEQLFQGMTRIVDRFAVGDLSKDRYEYHENQFDGPIYPETGRYQDLLDGITKHYRLLGNAEDVHAGRLLTPEYLRSVLKTKQDSMKFEYCDQDQNIYKVMHVIPMEWDAEGALTKVMMIAQDIGERVALETMANTDGLTGLFNGRYFGTVLQEKEKKKFPFVLFYLDLDHFKPINDTYGHDMGDKLLKEVAARLQRCIRSKDHAFRIGGDEFALLIGADLDEAHCQQLRDRIRQELSQPFYLEGQVLHVGVSCGYAAYPRDSSRATEVRILADQRMYAQKEEHHGDGPASGPAKR